MSRLLLVNMAVSDLLVGGVACLPSAAASIQGSWTLGHVFCQVSSCGGGGGVGGSDDGGCGGVGGGGNL